MRRRIVRLARPAIIIAIYTIILLEVGFRIIGSTNADGNYSLLNLLIPPFEVPLEHTQSHLDEYFSAEDEAILVYDAQLGWTNGPNRVSRNGLYHFNADGLRSDVDYAPSPAADTLRIALFGDSFMAGDEVAYDATIGFQLEQGLRQQGIRAEVLNFGVFGYGMDQAYLRWQTSGQAFQPDIVLFGFQPDNIDRNGNVFRTIVIPAAPIPFTKPRYVLSNNELQLVNQPTLPPTEIVAALADIEHSPLLQFESFYDSRYQETLLGKSRLYSVLRLFIAPPDRRRRMMLNELAFAIVRAFAADVTAAGSQFLVIHLPDRRALGSYTGGSQPDYHNTLTEIETIATVIHAENIFADNRGDYWMPNYHYSPTATRLIADHTVEFVTACLRDASCLPQRFQEAASFWQE